MINNSTACALCWMLGAGESRQMLMESYKGDKYDEAYAEAEHGLLLNYLGPDYSKEEAEEVPLEEVIAYVIKDNGFEKRVGENNEIIEPLEDCGHCAFQDYCAHANED